MRQVRLKHHTNTRSIENVNLSTSEMIELRSHLEQKYSTHLYRGATYGQHKVYIKDIITQNSLVETIQRFFNGHIVVVNVSGNVLSIPTGSLNYTVAVAVGEKVIDLTDDKPKEFYIVGNLKNDRFPFSQMKLHSTEEEALAYAQQRFAAKPHNTYYILKTVSVVHPTKPESNVTKFPITKVRRKR